MNASEHETFIDAWAATWEMYGRNMSTAGLRMALAALKDLELGTVLAALENHIQQCPDKPPTPAAIRNQISGSPAQQAQAAWDKLRRGIRRVGPYASVVFDDPLTQRIVSDMGGWVAVNNWKTDEVPFRARDFERRYQTLLTTAQASHPPHLKGLTEMHNQSGNTAIEPPRMIGSEAGARKVMATGKSDRTPTFGAGDSAKVLKFNLPTTGE